MATKTKPAARILNPCKTDHHAGCKGAHHHRVTPAKGDPIDEVWTCACPCHEADNRPRCLRCGARDVDLAGGYCADHDACDIFLADVLDNDPTMAKVRLANERAKAERAAADPIREAQRQERKERVAKPKVGRCEHCGEPTKGGRFVAGHDAKLKGELKRAAEAGDVDALVELEVRNWPTHTAKVDDAFRAQAEQRLPQNAKTWLAQRVEARVG